MVALIGYVQIQGGPPRFLCWLIFVLHFLIANSLFVTAIVDDERLSAEQMDERRRQNIAYEYLCHLEEAKQ